MLHKLKNHLQKKKAIKIIKIKSNKQFKIFKLFKHQIFFNKIQLFNKIIKFYYKIFQNNIKIS